MTARTLRGRAARDGQAVIELGLSLPLLTLLLLGFVNVGFIVNDNARADFTVRQAGRLATTVGGSGSRPNDLTATSSADLSVVENVLDTARTMPFARPLEVDIYSPSAADGVYTPGDPADIWDVSGASPVETSDDFPLSARDQTFPAETSIGVRLVWSFSPVNTVGIGPPSGTGCGLSSSGLIFCHYAVFKELAIA